MMRILLGVLGLSRSLTAGYYSAEAARSLRPHRATPQTKGSTTPSAGDLRADRSRKELGERTLSDVGGFGRAVPLRGEHEAAVFV